MVFFRSFGPCEYESENRPIAFARSSRKVRAVVTFPKGRHSIFYPRGVGRVGTEYTERVGAEERPGNERETGRETEGGFDATTKI
jgi:hypothetical protein